MSVTDELITNDARQPSRSPTLQDDVRRSITRILDSPYVPEKGSVRGFVFDVATGRLSEVR